MKFIQVFNRYLKPGGEETSVNRIAAHLQSGGHQVSRFWRSSTEWSGPGAPAKFRQPLLMWRNRTVLCELRALHEREKPHAWILHNVLPVISLAVYRLARELNVPVIQWLHNYRPLSPSGTLVAGKRLLDPEDPWLVLKEIWAGSWRGRFLTGWIALAYATVKRRGDFTSVRSWIAVSEEMRRIFERGGWPTERLFTLHHAWDIQTLSPATTDEGYFLYLGRMIEAKGVRFLVDLWQHPSLKNVPLVMAGEGPLCDELRNTAANVRWVGFAKGEEKHRLVAGCRAVVFPSLWQEPLSTVAYEAYEMGKPMLSSGVGGMNELVFDQETGRSLPPGDKDAWLEAIVSLVADARTARLWGLNGRRWLEENVSPQNWNRQFNTILEEARI